MNTMQFNFEKFKKLCNEDDGGVLYLRDKESCVVLHQYLEQENVKCEYESAIGLGFYIWYNCAAQKICSFEWSNNGRIIYQIEDFLTEV